jgi:insecticidal toxin complex protein TccC
MSIAVHQRTPTLLVNDSRGLAVRQVDYLRKIAGGPVQPLIIRQVHDSAGRLTEQRDARLFGTSAAPNLHSTHGLSGQPVAVASVDAGWRLSLFGISGEVLQHWDQRGNHWHTTYDEQLRVVAVAENARPAVECFGYADASADAGHNLRGQPSEFIDAAGTLRPCSYSLSGQALRESRTFADGQAYLASRTFSPLGAVLEQIDAGEHRQQFRHDVAGQLTQVMLQLKDASETQILQRCATYNAAGQMLEQVTGATTRQSTYDAANGQLLELRAGQTSKPLHQHLHQHLTYTYDRAGNILNINDHTLATVYFANQRVDGLREFAYDSLYRLSSASGFEADTPTLQPGLPELISPIDPSRRYRYTEHYAYDPGNNLETLHHVRDGNHFTRQMCIDPTSNRAVRWQEGDPQPIFDELFDLHGNLLAVQRGQPMQWNARDQLVKVTLLTHSNGLPDDEETYLYSQGVRVCKRHVTHTPVATHYRQTRYLPGLDICTRSNGEILHVISVALAGGSVRCLHWIAGQPDGIAADQLRFGFDDHLGSSTLELDQHGALISQEIFYPFGGTAWWAARSAVEASCKTIRYSGKEMDASGLYYYGARYYAPWLQRWVGADPAGDVDGLNLYAFVGNNPLNYFDGDGAQRTPDEARTVLHRYSNLLNEIDQRLDRSMYQFNHLFRKRDIYQSGGKRFALAATNVMASAIVAGFVAANVAALTSWSGPAAPALGVAAAALAADVTGKIIDKAGGRTSFGYPFQPAENDYDVDAVQQAAAPTNLKKSALKLLKKYDLRTTDGAKEMLIAGTIGAADNVSATTHLEKYLSFFRLSTEFTETLNDSHGQRDLQAFDQKLGSLVDFLNAEIVTANEALEELAGAGQQFRAEAAGINHRLGKIEYAMQGKIQRVHDLSQKLSARRLQKRAA